ncbi:AMP-dependent synthetase/ligase [Albibacterium bauzanense]|uniref:Long-chain acyl-CoA synthetase n=1 Tax=Albibacterium bauzanense TaxID=653929 RepID=A0A4R1M4I3_9SPHI|nr:long-chain fatty acid--CoA ligase [Albibacterium bauzanense]TCK85794.1 long-chain acyl-CoA synthetase [Albibacterium bauzanense]
MAEIKRVFDLLKNYEKHFSKEVMVAGKFDGKWKIYSTEDFIHLVNDLSRALAFKGIAKNDKVALMSANRPEWNFCDFGVMQLGAAVVPLYPTLAEQDLQHILKDAEVKMIFVSNAELYAKLRVALDAASSDIPVYSFDRIEGVTCWLDLLEEGKSKGIDLNEYRDAVSEDDLLTLIYTSGTTGKPKGVCLSHLNLMSNVMACQSLFPAEYKVAVSFLPLSHVFERMVVYIYFSLGISVYYAESMDTIIKDINDVKPNGFTTVPRVLEKVYEAIVAKGKALTGIKKGIFFWALDLGLKYKEPLNNSAFYNLQLKIARKLVFVKWQEALGGNVVALISGGAALQERLARVFWAADIPVLEGYGLTETSPVIAVNGTRDDEIRFGTVGKVLSNLEVKIAEDGEVLCKGPSVFKNYYKNEQATADVLDKDGFMHTGDIGELSKDGFLKITDRKKEMFKTSGGKFIAPQALENKFMESVLIAQVMVIGEGRRFPSALIVPAFDQLKSWCKVKGIEWTNKEEIIKLPTVIDKYQREIDRLNTDFGHWEQIKKFILLPKEWTIEASELTPKLSLKRKVILSNNAQDIEALYAEGDSN